jgi:hypothetical protein
VGTTTKHDPATEDQNLEAFVPAGLVELVRLLAQQAARDAFASADLVETSDSTPCEQEDLA